MSAISVADAIDYSRNFATAKPNIGKTEREHILGLCDLLEQREVAATVGEHARAFIQARKLRMAARRARTAAAVAFYEEAGSDAAYSDDSDHPRGYSAEFLAATGQQQAAYEAALNVEKSCRQKLYRAVSRVHGASA